MYPESYYIFDNVNLEFYVDCNDKLFIFIGSNVKYFLIIFISLLCFQAKWSDMFHMLEDEHRRELRSQYDRHQYNIQRLQQQMELELQKQHLAIRKKLDIHKEALAKMSPDRDSSSRLVLVAISRKVLFLEKILIALLVVSLFGGFALYKIVWE